MSQNDKGASGVVDLLDAGIPADQGLSSLGLLLQLAGNVFAAAAGVLMFELLDGRDSKTWLFLIFGSSIARSLLQRAGGTQMLYGTSSVDRMAGVRRYIVFAIVQTIVVTGVCVFELEAPKLEALGIAGGLAAWPAILAIILALPRFKRFRHDLPPTEDKGFEGTAILMTVLGLGGVCAMGSILIMLLDTGGEVEKGAGVLVVLALAMLALRSLIHVQAGMSGLRETSVDRSVELASRYANFGVVSSFCAAGAMLMYAMSGSVDVVLLAMICGMCWVLMSWPMIIRRFYSDRQFADLLAGEAAPLHRRAPDAGLTSLGWLLIAHAGLGVSLMVPTLASHRHDATWLLAVLGAFGVRSIWWSVGLVILQAWAGYELVRMSPHSRILATVFGIVGTAVHLYISWPLLQTITNARGLADQSFAAFTLGPVAMAVIIPVATVVLVNRKIAPTAKARFRSRPTEPTSP
ncbi:MAG: hypothetical protein JWO36_6141 [Myxococcales bacterium]|nr:hypothetical protein [Myxococcales bacterium]